MFDGKRRAAGQSDAGVIAGAHVLVDAEALANLRSPSRTDFWNSGFTRRCLLSMHSEEATITFGPLSFVVSASRNVSRIRATS